MSLEFNKIAAAVLVTGLVSITTGEATNFLYKPESVPKHKATATVTTTSTSSTNPVANTESVIKHDTNTNTVSTNSANTAPNTEQKTVDISTTNTVAMANPVKQHQDDKIDIAKLMAVANIKDGEKAAKKCAACHTFTKDGHNRVGPNLFDVVGREKASKDKFNYSDALKAKGGKWTQEELFHFINKPQKFIPGTRMTFPGFKSDQEIADVIKYLETLK